MGPIVWTSLGASLAINFVILAFQGLGQHGAAYESCDCLQRLEGHARYELRVELGGALLAVLLLCSCLCGGVRRLLGGLYCLARRVVQAPRAASESLVVRRRAAVSSKEDEEAVTPVWPLEPPRAPEVPEGAAAAATIYVPRFRRTGKQSA